jgi:hypothetical protein
VGTAGDDRFVHTPGNAPDSGKFDIFDRTNNQTMMGIQYQNIDWTGTVTADGLGGADALVALGTSDSDRIDVSFTAANAIDLDLTDAFGTHVDLLSLAVEDYEVRSGEGDDDLNLTAPSVTSWRTFAIYGGGPESGSDAFNVISGAGSETITIRPDTLAPDDQDVVFRLAAPSMSSVMNSLTCSASQPTRTRSLLNLAPATTWVVSNAARTSVFQTPTRC